MKKHLRKYYFSDDHVGVKELHWARLRVAGAILGGTILAVGCILIVAYSWGNFGNERRQISNLRRDNQALEDQLAQLTGRMQGLEKTISQLSDEGNHLRLLVDLPPIDDATRKAGTGGAIAPTNLPIASDQITSMIRGASSTIDKLTNEISLEKQNYEEISKKQNFNKEFFASMPALKPMEGYYSTNGFGLRMHPVLGIFKDHKGLDIINDVGTPVYASADGNIEIAGQTGGGYGIMILIDHGFGYETLYAHLSQVLVKEHAHVKRGDLIAKSGRTGLVSGPHLHYEVRYKGVIQNPVNYFLDDVKPSDLKSGVAEK